MQPRPHGRGNRGHVAALFHHGSDASMQPRPHGRGNGTGAEAMVRLGKLLQCSRGLTAAEIGPTPPPKAVSSPLQCSRGLTAAEMPLTLSITCGA